MLSIKLFERRDGFYVLSADVENGDRYFYCKEYLSWELSSEKFGFNFSEHYDIEKEEAFKIYNEECDRLKDLEIVSTHETVI